MHKESDELPRIAVFSGPTATIQKSPPLVTSNKARAAHGLDLLPGRFDGLRPQRLAAPVTTYVEQFSAHPLEADAADLCAAPDGWLDEADGFHEVEIANGRPVYKVVLEPDDGLYLLPYMARQVDGSPWDDAAVYPLAPPEKTRQTFYPDARRIYEEIDRFALDTDGRNNLLSRLAGFDFYRAIPSAGYKRGRVGPEPDSSLGPEIPGEDFFYYSPHHLRNEPTTRNLARATNLIQRVLASGKYLGAQWLEGSPTCEESLYWFDLLVDTRLPIVGHAAQRAHNTISADGDHNILSGVEYIVSRIWADDDGANQLGSVMIVDQRVYSAREVAKTDARPGNYEVVGGHGGTVASLGAGHAPFRVTFLPARKYTHGSEVNLTRLPQWTEGVTLVDGDVAPVRVQVKSPAGELLDGALPRVTFEKYGRYRAISGVESVYGTEEPGIAALVKDNLARFPLAGFIGEGNSPYGALSPATDRALRYAVFSGMPVVKVGRGNTGGDAGRRDSFAISGSNLSATKARMLLMACLLKLGAPPPALDPEHPSPGEVIATGEHVAGYQRIFDTH
ncbi:MAG: asparaginase domain-containing protein [Acidimicrobiales bacterium]